MKHNKTFEQNEVFLQKKNTCHSVIQYKNKRNYFNIYIYVQIDVLTLLPE